jgi:hypothetical protein
LQFDGVEASATADATLGPLAAAGTRTFSGNGLQATVQAWANGAPNYGWAIVQDQSDRWTVRTSEDLQSGNRPRLVVTYQPPIDTLRLKGNGVTVAVIDSGMLPGAGASSRVKTTRDFTTGLVNPPAVSVRDGYGHGTHVASLIGGDGEEATGVAPAVKFVSLRVLDNTGAGTTSSVIKALEWAVVNKAAYGIDVINLSLGHPIYEPAATDPLVQAVEAAARSGIAVVVSAGNVGTNRCRSWWATPESHRPATLRRPSRWVPSRRWTPRAGSTTSSPTTARVARR